MDLILKLDEEKLAIKIEEEIIEQALSDNFYDIRRGVKTGIEKAVKEYIYINKDEIIEKVVNRATAEIVKKGILKLLERGELK